MSTTRLAVVGAFLVGGILLFGVGLFMIGDRRLLFTEHFQLATEFSRVTGMQVGTKVRVSGVDAGEVLEITIPSRPSLRFRVTMRVRGDLRPLIRTDSVATVLTDGLLGAVFIQIGAGTDAAPIVEPGALIEGRDAIEFADLIEEGRDTFRTLAGEAIELKDEISGAIAALTDTITTANQLIDEVGTDARTIAKAGTAIADDARLVLADARGVLTDLRAGRGTIGRLLTDDALYTHTVGIARQAEETMGQVRAAVEQVERTVADFRAEDGPAQAIMADVREVLGYARDATSDLAENTEALKRNFLFRGFFNRRGFFDLGDLTVEEYRSGSLEGGRRTALRIWLDAAVLFAPEAAGGETLTENGRRRLDSAMAAFVRYPRDSPLVVEGYATAGGPDARFLLGQERGDLVRDYLVRRFRRSANLTGVMPMGATAEGAPRTDGRWDGVALALFVRSEAIASVQTASRP